MGGLKKPLRRTFPGGGKLRMAKSVIWWLVHGIEL